MAALLLSVPGFYAPLVLVCLALGFVHLPTAPVLGSAVGRLFLSAMVFMGAFQVAVTGQALLAPDSTFLVPATLLSVAYLALLGLRAAAPSRRPPVTGAVTRQDAVGFVVAGVFVVPFAPILVGADSVERIAQVAGGQAIDGINHFWFIARMGSQQNWQTASVADYPLGFHSTVAFLLEASGGSPAGTAWVSEAFMYLAQYLVFGVALSMAMGYLFAAVLRNLGGVGSGQPFSRGLHVAGGLGLAAAAVPLVLLPFVQQGFLNYLYVLATVVLGFTVLLERTGRRLDGLMAVYLVLVFGAGASWPLLTPPLVATSLLVLWSAAGFRQLRTAPVWKSAVLVGLLLIQWVPVARQVVSPGSGDGLAASGSLDTFRPLGLVLALGLVLGVIAIRREQRPREVVIAIVLPAVAFVGLLSVYQFFVLGEVRYYVIKSAYLVEVTTLTVLVGLLTIWLGRADVAMSHRFCVVLVTPPLAALSLAAVVANPVEDVRNLFRTAAAQTKPAFFDQDIGAFSRLGEQGLLTDFNATSLHYDPVAGRFAAHMQIPYWAGMLQFDGSVSELPAQRCALDLYESVSFTEASPEQQEGLLNTIEECAVIARDDGSEFYIVTDAESAPLVRDRLGSTVEVVVGES